MRITGRLSVKILALIIAAILVGAGGLYLWAEFLRHWSTQDLEEQVISDPIPATPGFKHNLAGRTVTVEGRIASIDYLITSQGPLSFIYTHSSDYIGLVVWGETDFEVDDKIEMKVHFEWATCNDETHVYSPELAFPWYTMVSTSVVEDSISATCGLLLIPDDVDDDTVRLEVFDQYPALSASYANCSLRAGTSSYVLDYVQSTDIFEYGRELDHMANLSAGASENDMIDFVDMDDDGWVTAGDYFEISGIERPEEDSGIRTYMVTVGRTNVTDSEYLTDILAGCSYLVIAHEGVLRPVYSSEADPPMTPYGRGSVAVDGNQATVTCERLIEGVSWDDLSIQLWDGTSHATATWHPSEDGLDDEGPDTEELGANILGGTDISCSVTDIAGNGYMDEGDYFIFTAPSGFTPSGFYSASVIFLGTNAQVFDAKFQM